jgi:predicted acylesterase/phospholipase RssA
MKQGIGIKHEGGAAAGAVAAGFLRRLFLHNIIKIEFIRGTSAGGMNGMLAEYGFELNGPQGAADKLYEGWHYPI